jgi:hypothetical protein
MTRAEIIEDLKDQVKGMQGAGVDPDSASWNYTEGVILTINEAKFILSLLNDPYGEEVKPGKTGEAGA